MIGPCDSLDEFRARCEPLGLYTSRRFIHLELDITNKCNIQCVMCYHSYDAVRRGRTVTMTPAEFASNVGGVLPHCHRVSLSLGNEPLLSPHFVDILERLAPYQVPDVNFFTNGQLLDAKRIDAIVRCGITQVCISIESARAATYNAIRRGGDFDRLLSNIERLLAARTSAGQTTPRLRFDILMMRRNVHELPDLVRLARRVGVQALSFRHLVVWDGLDMEDEPLHRTKAFSNYWFEQALAVAEEYGLVVESRPELFALHGDEAPAPAPAPASPFDATPYCPFPFFHISLGPGGHVLPCPYSHGEQPYGRVTVDHPLDQVWLNPRFMELRERILRHDPPDMCRRCSFMAFRHPDWAPFFAPRSA